MFEQEASMYFIGINKKDFDIYESKTGTKRGEVLRLKRKEVKVWFVFHKRHQNFVRLLREISRFAYSDDRFTKSFAELITSAAERHGSTGIIPSWNLLRAVALEDKGIINGALLLQMLDQLSIGKERGKKITVEILQQYAGAEKP